jgi:hypothetical protein
VGDGDNSAVGCGLSVAIACMGNSPDIKQINPTLPVFRKFTFINYSSQLNFYPGFLNQ